jgi:outer membrane protein assembly factor BamB
MKALPPAMSDQPSSTSGIDATDTETRLSRRQVLAAAGATGLGGGLGGYVLGNGIDETLGRSEDCDPPPLSRPVDGWAMPDYDLANTGHCPGELAPETLETTWRVDRDQTRFRAPVVANGTVLLPEVDDQVESESRVRAFDLQTGEERWQSNELCCGPGPGGAVVAGDTVFVHTRDGVAALALADGSTLWTGTPKTDRGAVTAAPVVTDGLLTLHQRLDESIRVDTYDARTGQHCATRTLDFEVREGPALSPTRRFVAADGDLIALDRDDWSIDWRQALPRRAYVAPRYHDGQVYVSGFDGHLVALAADSGAIQWTVEFENYVPGGRSGDREYARPTPEFGAVTSAAVVVREEVYSDYSDRIVAFDPASGDRLWELTAPADREYGFANPVAAGDRVYTVVSSYSDDRSRLLELDISTGARRNETALEVDGGAQMVLADGGLVVAALSGVQVLGDE